MVFLVPLGRITFGKNMGFSLALFCGQFKNILVYLMMWGNSLFFVRQGIFPAS